MKVCLQDLYNGKTFKVAIHRKVIVGKATVCDACRGSGVIKQVRQLGPGFVQETQHQCEICNGLGQKYEQKNEKKEIEAVIKPGMTCDTKLRFSGLGNEIPGVETGDIVFSFKVQKHDMFARKGDNLFVKLRISLAEALTGCNFDIKHLDGRVLSIETPKNTILSPPTHGGIPLKCIPNEGMPLLHDSSKRGMLIIAFIIQYPPSGYFDSENITTIRKILPNPLHKASNKKRYELRDVEPHVLRELNRNEQKNTPFDEFAGTQCAQM